MSERITGIYDDALYKLTYTLLYFTLRRLWHNDLRTEMHLCRVRRAPRKLLAVSYSFCLCD